MDLRPLRPKLTVAMPTIPLDLPDIPPEEAYAAAASAGDAHAPRRFEDALAAHCGRRHAIACATGPAAAWAALAGLRLSPGDEVICSALVPDNTLLAMAAMGVRPVFVDVDPARMVASPAAVEAAQTPRTRAVVAAVGAAGQAGIEAVAAVTRRLELPLLEDGGQAFGSLSGQRLLGTIGRASFFDFGHGAPMTAWCGGALLTDDDRLAESARKALTDPCCAGLLPLGAPMPPHAAALGLAQLHRLPEILARRHALARCYLRHLLEIPDLILPDLQDGETHAWPVLWARLSTDYRAAQRDDILAGLLAHGIHAGKALRCAHRMPACVERFGKTTALPVAEALSKRTLRLPLFNRMREEQVEDVCRALTAELLKARLKMNDWPEGGQVNLED